MFCSLRINNTFSPVIETRIDLRQSPQNEQFVNLKSAGTPDGIQVHNDFIISQFCPKISQFVDFRFYRSFPGF